MLQISDEAALGRAELFARLDRVAALPAEACAHFAVQLRDPALDAAGLLTLGQELRRRTRVLGAKLFVNDRLDLAVTLGADGVHLGRGSVAVAEARRLLAPGGLVTRSCHGLDEIAVLGAEQPDAVILSPIFPTLGKTASLGLEAVAEARALLPPNVSLIALGGIQAVDAEACLQAGADGVASIRADLTGSLARRPGS